jgi:hypothetical protein
VTRAVFIACLLAGTNAFAAGKKVAVIEAKTKNVQVQGLERGLRAALKVNHGYVAMGVEDLQKIARGMGLPSTAALTSEQLLQVAKKAGIDLLVLVRAKAEGKQVTVDMRVDATDARGTIWSSSYPLKKPKLDRVAATDMARDVRAADASGAAKKDVTTGNMEFSLDEAPKAAAKPAPKATGSEDGDGEDDGGKIAESSAAEQRAEVAAEGGEDEEEFYEPTEVDENAPKIRYVPPDGRTGFVGTAGLDMLIRRTLMSAANGTPPRYDGVFSPGVTLHAELFPRRFREGGTIYREFGGYADFAYAFMPSDYIQGGVAKNFTDQYLMVEAGAVWRRVFGNQEKSPALGARVGVHYDQLTLSKGLPFPSTSYGAPYLGVDGELPLAGKMLVLIGRLGILPVVAVGTSQTQAFGQYRYVFGLQGTAGVRSTLYNTLYLQATGQVFNYFEFYGDTGSSKFRNVNFSDLYAAFNVAIGLAY